MNRKTNGVSRRGFIGAIGAATAVVALPTLAAPAGGDTFRDAMATSLPELRRAYLRKVESFTVAQRAGFESGELCATEEEYFPPALDALIERDFGLPASDFESDKGDGHIARAILAVSPSAHRTDRGSSNVCHAHDCVVEDVWTAARARGWLPATEGA